MMRRSWLALALALTACGRAPETGQAGETMSSAGGIAFAYRYDFRLPSVRIADAQEAHARACEQLGPARCRITGMTYRLDSSGQASASLDLGVASPIARRFGRTGVQEIERGGGALTGAEIVGTDTAAQITAAQRGTANARTDLAEVDRQLALRDLPAQLRRDLVARRNALIGASRLDARVAADARTRTAITPVSFTYRAGTGVGLAARLSEAAQAAYASFTWTLTTALTLLAWLGPPLILLLLLLLVWHRFGRTWWRRAFPSGPVDPA